MRALVLYGIKDIRLENVLVPDINENEALVKVKAAGICASDIMRIKCSGSYYYPIILGHEFSGDIVKQGELSPFKIGDRVSAYPLIPCMDCRYCQSGNYPQCKNYQYLGSRTNGAFAEYVKVPIQNLVKIPNEVSFIEAALIEPTAVAHHMVKLCNINLGDVVAILGSGTIGILAAQWARVYGARRVILIDTQERKLELGREMGFNELINYSQGDSVRLVRETTNGDGCDKTIEASGCPEALITAIEITRPLGRIGLVGNMMKNLEISKEHFSQILRKGLIICGSWNSTIDPDWIMSIKNLESKSLTTASLITHLFSLSQGVEAFNMIMSGIEFYNKVMFIFE